MIGNKTSSLAPTSQNLSSNIIYSNRIKKIDILRQMNELTNDLMENGSNMSQYLINKIAAKSSLDMGDIEALNNLRITDIEPEKTKVQDRG